VRHSLRLVDRCHERVNLFQSDIAGLGRAAVGKGRGFGKSKGELSEKALYHDADYCYNYLN